MTVLLNVPEQSDTDGPNAVGATPRGCPPRSMKSRNVPGMRRFRDGANGLRICNPGRHGGLGQAQGPAPTGMVSSVFPERSDMDRPNVVGAGHHDGRMGGRDDAGTRTCAGHRGGSPGGTQERARVSVVRAGPRARPEGMGRGLSCGCRLYALFGVMMG